MVTRPRVLFVEDDKNIRSAYAMLLVNAGYNVTECGSVAAACMHLDLSDLYAVVLDLTLPNGRGEKVVEALIGKRNDVPVVIFSAFRDEHGWSWPVVAYLEKPPGRDTFLGAVRKAVQKSADVKELRGTTRRLADLIGIH